MRPTRIQIARPDIIKFFEENPQKIFRLGDIASILQHNRSFWRLTQNLTTAQFLDYLLKSTDLHRVDFPFSVRKELRYVWGPVPYLEVLLDLFDDSYLSHYGAVRIHGLTEQIPKVYYLNIEQAQRVANMGLTQKGIDFAFRGSPRVSSNVAKLGDYQVYQLHGKATNQLGVTNALVPDIIQARQANVRVTGIERTLIDITVRPMYAGGIHEVLKAYHLAVGSFSVNRMIAMLKQINYTYPYHQAIGFLLEKTEAFPATTIDLVRKIPREFDFYLTYKMVDPVFNERWRLWVPKGMDL